MSVLAQLRRGLHIRLIFVKCWEKTSLHSLSHRGCHCRTPPARRRSHPSQTHAHLQQRGMVAPSAKWGVHIFACMSYKYAMDIQVFDNFFNFFGERLAEARILPGSPLPGAGPGATAPPRRRTRQPPGKRARAEPGLSRRWVWKVPSSVTKTCVYYDIPVYFGISQVMFKIETSNRVKLGYLITNMRVPGRLTRKGICVCACMRARACVCARARISGVHVPPRARARRPGG